jgi:plastocyanin
MNKTYLWIAVVIIAIIAVAVGMNSYNPPVAGSPGDAGTLQSGASEPVASPAAADVREFTVTGTNFSFAPSTLTVKKGDTVKITFVNSGGTHDLRIDEFPGAATKKIGSGQSETITFVADKAGSFEYYCSVGTHRAMGMRGTLVVQ